MYLHLIACWLKLPKFGIHVSIAYYCAIFGEERLCISQDIVKCFFFSGELHFLIQPVNLLAFYILFILVCMIKITRLMRFILHLEHSCQQYLTQKLHA